MLTVRNSSWRNSAARVKARQNEPDFYLKHFSFDERPFSLVPNASFLYWSDQHQRAHSVLRFGVLSQAPIVLLTGGVGCGKTTLIHNLMEELGPEHIVGLVSQAHFGRYELMQWVSNAFGLPCHEDDNHVAQFQALQDYFIEQYANGRRVVLIFDEAQHVSFEALEELRMLVNINSGRDEVLQLILVGQSELRDKISHPKLRQLAQRISVAYHLEPMSEKATHNYICHRLRIAGGTGNEFDERARMLAYEVSEGVPRQVNQICDMALLYSWSSDQNTVNEAAVQAVIDDGIFFGAELARMIDAA